MAISIAFCSPVEHSAAGVSFPAMNTSSSSRCGPVSVRAGLSIAPAPRGKRLGQRCFFDRRAGDVGQGGASKWLGWQTLQFGLQSPRQPRTTLRQKRARRRHLRFDPFQPSLVRFGYIGEQFVALSQRGLILRG